jgi:hypothetical protein
MRERKEKSGDVLIRVRKKWEKRKRKNDNFIVF